MKRDSETPQVKIFLSEHFIEQWHRYIGKEKKTKIKAVLRRAILERVIYGRKDKDFEVFLRGTKVIIALTDVGWVAVTVLPPDSAEMLLHRSGLDELARKWGARLSFWNQRKREVGES